MSDTGPVPAPEDRFPGARNPGPNTPAPPSTRSLEGPVIRAPRPGETRDRLPEDMPFYERAWDSAFPTPQDGISYDEWNASRQRRVPDNLVSFNDKLGAQPTGDTVTSSYGIARHMQGPDVTSFGPRADTNWTLVPQVPTALHTDGYFASAARRAVAWRTEQRQTSDNDRLRSQGPGGNSSRYSDSTNDRVDMDRVNRWTSGTSFGEIGDWESYMDSDILAEGSVTPGGLSGSNTNDLIWTVVGNGNGGVAAMLDRAIQMSVDDPGLFNELQIQLQNHGFMAGDFVNGEWGVETAEALFGMVQGAQMMGSDMPFDQFLDRKYQSHFDATFEMNLDAMGTADAEAAAEMRVLREMMDGIDLTIDLDSPEKLKDDMNRLAVAQLGRRLSDAEMSAIVDDVHDEQRASFYSNNPDIKRYNELRKRLEDASTNAEERRGQVLRGEDASDLDIFMDAIMAQESGGDPNAVNPHSGAFGLFQFMPETWKGITRNAKLDPNDRSAENQIAAARYMAASYFQQRGNWRDVAIAWYAGPKGWTYSPYAMDRKQKNDHPSINEYVDEIISRMSGTHQDQSFGAADEFGSGMTIEQAKQWAKTQRNRNVIDTSGGQGLSDLDSELGMELPELGISEEFRFDVESYLSSAVDESGGIEADAYNYAQRAMEFFGELGRR